MKNEFNPDPKFPWTIDQVESVASMLYHRMPQGMSERDKWHEAAREAVNYLNARRNACNKALESDRAISETYSKAKKLGEEYEKLQEEWPYKKAVKYITGEENWDRANRKFQQFALQLRRGDEKKTEVDLQKYLGEIMKRSDVIELQTLFVPFWRHHTLIQNRAAGKKGGRGRKRKHWSPERRQKSLPKLPTLRD